MFQVRLLCFRQSLPLEFGGTLYSTHYHVAGVLKGEVHVVASTWLNVGWVNLVQRVGVRGFHGRGNGREVGCGCGGNTARGRNIAALAVAMETEGSPWPWENS